MDKVKMQQSPGFSTAMTKLTLRDVFFTALLYGLRIEKKDEGPIACTNGVFIRYNHELFDARPPHEGVFILAHELMHVVLNHSTRRGHRHPELWNIAADYVINILLVDDGLVAPKDCLHDTQYRHMTTEQVYDKLIKQAKDGETPPELGDMWADIEDYDPSDNGGKSAAQHEKEVGLATAEAAAKAKAVGSKSGIVDRFADNQSVQRQPWFQQLAKYMKGLNSPQFNWARRDLKRELFFSGVLCPKMASESIGKIIVGVDCSGSISDTQLGSMGSHLSDIMSDCRPSDIVIMYFDTQVRKEEWISGSSYDVRLKSVGGGGTSFFDVVEKAGEHADAELLIVFTDLCGPTPDYCDIPTLWVVNSDCTEPFGELIQADFNG